MIKNITCKDFQAHKDTTLEFSPTITCIVGENGSGKTAIFRALKAVLFNDCLGNDYVRLPDAKSFSVSITTGDGNVITRTKGAENSVSVSSLGTWKDFNREYPHQVTDTTRIKEVLLGDKIKTLLQVQAQLDAPYMLVGVPESTKMRFLNRLSGAYLLSEAIKQANNELTANKQTVTTNAVVIDELTNTKNTLEKSIASYDNVIDYIEQKLPIIESMEKQKQDLTTIKNNYTMWSWNNNTVTNTLSRFTWDSSKLEELLSKYEKLQQLQLALNSINQNIERINNLLQLTKKLDITTLINNVEKYVQISTYKNKISYVDFDINKISTSLKSVNDNIYTETKRLEKLLESLPECPICGAPIDKDKIINHLTF